MTELLSHLSVPMLAAFALCGSAAGIVHFAALDAQVRALTWRKNWCAVLLPILRFSMTVSILIFAAFHGAAALLAAVAGLLAARTFLLHYTVRSA